ncbi:unnamed protein product [Pieris brassicae]|uniref:MYND-type domain-containing protein n=1 Tax=Pieris brassicae TaxID=7116 RepID=A0A9P0TAD7_PIEBR|nr:unnamed protein product [Pieris brassicae]
MCCKQLHRSDSSNCVVFPSACGYCCDYFNCLRHLSKMMLMNDTSSTDDINCSNTIQLMQLFDLSQPKDIMTIIEVEPDDSDDTNTTIKESVDKAKTALSKKRKSVKENKSKTMKKSDLSIDKGKESSQTSNEFNIVTHQHLRSDNAINVHTMPYTHHFPISNYTQNNFPLRSLLNRLEDYSSDQREQAAEHNSHQCQMHSKNINWLEITNHSRATIRPWSCQTPVRSLNVQNSNQISYETNYGLNVIIEHVFNFLMYEFQNNSGLSQRKLKLFQHCYAYVVYYCLNRDLNNDYKVFNHIVQVVDSIARKRSQYINEKLTRLLLSEMFEWCRHRRSIDTNMERSWPPAYNDSQIDTLPPHIPTSVSQKNSNKSSQVNNETALAVNKDQTCLFTLGELGKEISINIDTCLLHTLQYKPETTLAKNENIQEKETSKLIQPPIKPSTGMTIPFEIVAGLNIPEKKDNKNEVQNQTEIVRSSVSRNEFKSHPNVNNLEVIRVSPRVVGQTPSNEDVTPMITHVTSLNSNASYISRGLCNVCKNETNTRCTGCYKVYYCSRECQLSEWYVHITLCKGTY